MYKKLLFIVLLPVLMFGCKKYERNNPNDELNTNNGSAILALSGYTVIKESGGDSIIQKGESATVELLVQNTGNTYTSLTNVEVTSTSTKITALNFVLAEKPLCYVGIENKIGQLSFQLSSNTNTGDIIPVDVKLTDKAGTVTHCLLNITIAAPSSGPFQVKVNYVRASGTSDDYSSAYKAALSIDYKNISDKLYNGPIKYVINSTDPQYPYHFEFESYANINQGEIRNDQVVMDCISSALHKNQNLKFSIDIIDQKGGTSSSTFNLLMKPDNANVSATNPRLTTPFKAGSPFQIYLDVINAIDSRNIGIDDVTITSNSPYVTNLQLQEQGSPYLAPGTGITNYCKITGALTSNCPTGLQVVFTVTISLYATDCDTPKSFTYQFAGTTQ